MSTPNSAHPKYTPLREGNLEFRLLSPLPLPEKNELYAELRTTPVLDALPYCALSYSWGEDPVVLQNAPHVRFTSPTRASRHRVQRMPASGEIHVLNLLPGESGLVKCELLPVSINNSGQYETLSYVWGDQDHNSVVLVDGVECKVTLNLEKALRRLRRPVEKRRLWVDQLCISQWDQREKTRQVNLMRDIYKNCTQSLLWFGEIDQKTEEFSVNDAQAAVDLIDWVAAGGIVSDIDPPSTLSSNAAFKGALIAFKSMVLNSWWSRIWTVQEAVLPP